MATQNTKTKTTLADKDKKVLMILGALVILALAWFLGYQKFNEQRETVATENDQLAMEVSQLRAKVSKKAQVELIRRRRMPVPSRCFLHIHQSFVRRMRSIDLTS